jgi:hypothetical protein
MRLLKGGNKMQIILLSPLNFIIQENLLMFLKINIFDISIVL